MKFIAISEGVLWNSKSCQIEPEIYKKRFPWHLNMQYTICVFYCYVKKYFFLHFKNLRRSKAPPLWKMFNQTFLFCQKAPPLWKMFKVLKDHLK